MLNDKRKAPRRPIHYTAWIKLAADDVRGCAIADVSDTGARIDIESSEGIPDEFTLLLSARGTPKRKCKVVWRSDEQLGVEFEKKLPKAEGPKKRSEPAPPLVPDAAEAKPEADAASATADSEDDQTVKA